MKQFSLFVAAAALIGAMASTSAEAQVNSGDACAFVCDQVLTTTCEGGEEVVTESSIVVHCENHIDNPTAACGQTCIDGVALVGGWAGMAVPEGCIGAADGTIGTHQYTGGGCVESAVAACESKGCAMSMPMHHPCSHTGYKQRKTINVDDTDGTC